MVKTQSQTVIVNVKQEKEKRKRKRRTTKKASKASPQGVSQVSQNQSVNAIYRGVQEPAIQQRFLAPDPQTTRVLNDLSQALQTYKQQSTPRPPPPSNAVIVSPPVGAMPTPIAPAPKAKATQQTPSALVPIKKVKIPEKKREKKQEEEEVLAMKSIEDIIASLPRNAKGQVKRQGPEWKALSNTEKAIVRDIEEKAQKPKKEKAPKAPKPEPEPEPEPEAEAEAVQPEGLKKAKPKNIKSATPKNKISMLLDNSASQLYPTSKLGQPEVQKNDIDDALQEVD